MRKIILGLLLSICSVFHAEAQAPDWVTQRPTSSDAYIGIGVASLSETDYMKKRPRTPCWTSFHRSL